jgi:hypothetical protein
MARTVGKLDSKPRRMQYRNNECRNSNYRVDKTRMFWNFGRVDE